LLQCSSRHRKSGARHPHFDRESPSCQRVDTHTEYGLNYGLNVIATDPIHKATIIPRGRALGMVMQLPERDKLSTSREQMTSRLAIMMGGRVAEELVFGKDKVTSGASSDIERRRASRA
jgi:ATP-dependent Zn protease